jgi:kynureninase
MLAYIDAWEHHTSEDAWATSWWTLSRASAIASRAFSAASPAQFRSSQTLRSRLATVASCFDFNNGRNKVVTTALDFPSMEYFWDAQRQIGARVEVVPRATASQFHSNESSTRSTTKRVSSRCRTRPICSSYRIDCRAIVEHAHAKGALVLLDVYQSAGVVQLHAADWNVDFLIGGTIKWLCGGPSCGYLYVRPDLQRDLRRD